MKITLDAPVEFNGRTVEKIIVRRIIKTLVGKGSRKCTVFAGTSVGKLVLWEGEKLADLNAAAPVLSDKNVKDRIKEIVTAA
jgi:hypothetical protein